MDPNFNLDGAWYELQGGLQRVHAGRGGGMAQPQIKALKAMLRNEPEVRPDRVQKAMALIAQEDWPSAEVVQRVSELLASRMTESAD